MRRRRPGPILIREDSDDGILQIIFREWGKAVYVILDDVELAPRRVVPVGDGRIVVERGMHVATRQRMIEQASSEIARLDCPIARGVEIGEAGLLAVDRSH